MEAIPDFAYTWRPYANERIVYKEVTANGKRRLFIIDPWTQRWVLSDDTGAGLLKLANGRRRFSEILRTVCEDAALPHPGSSFVDLALHLQQSGLLYDCKEAHRASGLPVYNKADPIGFHLEITNACNMTCEHCYVSSGKKLANELTFEEICAAIDLLPPFTGKRVAISGGEPAVRRDCAKILEYCAITCGHDVDLYTNGKNFPVALAEEIMKINLRGMATIRVQVSLEGASAATNDQVRGLGSFAATLKSLEMFQRMGLNRHTVIFVCLTKQNMPELEAIIGLAERYDVAMLVFSQWQKQGNASNTPWEEIAPSLEEWTNTGEKLFAYHNDRLRVYGNFYGDLRNNAEGRFSLDGELFPKQVYFYNGFPRVTPDGKIFADQLWVDPSWILGDVRSDTFDEVFDSAAFAGQLEAMRHRVENIPECSECEWKDLCEGGSAGHTYAEYGHLNARDVFCASRIYWFNRFVNHQVEKSEKLHAEPR